MTALPSTTQLGDRIAFFLAVRSGDVSLARTLLDRWPGLLEAEDHLTTEDALTGTYPHAHRVTPLIVAAARGDREMLELLLARGASVDRGCGCGRGETALWIASRCGHTDVAERLLAAGADPKRKNRAGFTPAAVARLRSPERVRMHGRRIETGIKALDLLAPLELGMLVRVHGAAGTGLMLLVAELSSRFGDAVWLPFGARAGQRDELRAFAAQSAIRPDIDGDFRGRATFAFAEEGRPGELQARLPALALASIAFVVDPWSEATRKGVRPELAAPYDALLVTDPHLARAGVHPAIDPRRTRSKASVSLRHAAIARAVRQSTSEAVWRCFQQSFGVNQHRTGKPGETYALEETLAAFERLLDSRALQPQL